MRYAAIIFAILAAIAASIVVDAFFLHLLPLGFEGTLVYGAYSTLGGAACAVLALSCVAVAHWRSPNSRASRLPIFVASISLAAIVASIVLSWHE
jgi:Na+-translocating ferredoxin:NAD+ oxidoreductase RnfE subunit